jgi:pimeloyl-ACP methyl ester carboxylesterase
VKINPADADAHFGVAQAWDPSDSAKARQALKETLDTLGPHTIVIGHSLGAALLLDLTGDRAFDKMVLLSPAPTSVDPIRAERVLVLTGQFDQPRIVTFVHTLETSGAGAQNIHIR